MMQKLLIAMALFIGFFVAGFLGSLGIHWSIRPSLETPATPMDISSSVAAEPAEITALNRQVIELETTLTRVQTEYRIDEGHARALIQELQTYRDERDRLFSDLEARKQKVINKIEELDEKIQMQLAQRDDQFGRVPDYELDNELMGLLNYPHRLNDNPALYQKMTRRLSHHQEFIEKRFALMLQPVDYAHIDRLYRLLDPIIEQLNETHGNDTQLLAIHCSERYCEIQLSLQPIQPYFDYWQQWLTELAGLNATKLIEHQITAKDDGLLTGAVIIKQL